MKTSKAIHALAGLALITGMFFLGTVTPPLIKPTAALICGDGVLDEGEHCDDGNTNDGDACSANCLYTFCGDSLVQQPNASGENEECDDRNTIPADGCSPSCTFEDCGNSVVQEDRGEQCDDGLANSDTQPNACRRNCTLPRCGDGVADGGETCDDGNTDDADDCPATCILTQEEEEIPEEPAAVAPAEQEELKPAAREESTTEPLEPSPVEEESATQTPVIEHIEEEALREITEQEAVSETTEIIMTIEAEAPDLSIVPKSFAAALSALENNDLEGAREAVFVTLEEKPTIAVTVQTIQEDPKEGQVAALDVVQLVKENITCLQSDNPETCSRMLSASLEEKEEEGAARRKKKQLIEEAKETKESKESKEEPEPEAELEVLTNAQMTVALARAVEGAVTTVGTEYWDTEEETKTIIERVEARLASRIAAGVGRTPEEVIATFAQAGETGDLSTVRQLLRDAGVKALTGKEEKNTQEQISKREEELRQTLDLASRADPRDVATPQQALANLNIVSKMVEPLKRSIRDLENVAFAQSFSDRLQLLSARIESTDTQSELATLIAGLQALASDVSIALSAERQEQTLLEYLIRRVSSLLTPEAEAADVALSASLLGGKTVVIGNLSLWVTSLGGLTLAITLPGLHRRRDRRAQRRFQNIASNKPQHQARSACRCGASE